MPNYSAWAIILHGRALNFQLSCGLCTYHIRFVANLMELASAMHFPVNRLCLTTSLTRAAEPGGGGGGARGARGARAPQY